jgi:hypothetical protein
MAGIDPVYLLLGVSVLGFIAGYAHRASISRRRRRVA